MSDLTDEELERWLASVPVCRYEPADMQRMALELQRRRSAQAADRERVRQVVAAAALALLHERTMYIVKPQHPTMGEIALEAYGHGKACDAVALLGDDLQAVLDEIADRVADQLAMHLPSGQDVVHRAIERAIERAVDEALGEAARQQGGFAGQIGIEARYSGIFAGAQIIASYHPASPAIADVVSAAAQRFDARPIHRASIEARTELAEPAETREQYDVRTGTIRHTVPDQPETGQALSNEDRAVLEDLRAEIGPSRHGPTGREPLRLVLDRLLGGKP